MDPLELYYNEHAAQARHHEDQREKVSNLVFTLAGILVGFVTYAKFSISSWPAAAGVAVLGAFGAAFAAKHYERNRLHVSIMAAIRHEIERVHTTPGCQRRSLSRLRDIGEIGHYTRFKWAYSATKDRQRTAVSVIARSATHVFWEAVHLCIGVVGLGLVVAVILHGNEQPEIVQIQSPVTVLLSSNGAQRGIGEQTAPAFQMHTATSKDLGGGSGAHGGSDKAVVRRPNSR